jgi:trehalose 6-phosphate synthase
MRREFRFLSILIIGLSCLTIVGHIVVNRETRRWFEDDLARRAQLAVASARGGLVSAWKSDRPKVAVILTDITRDERIMGAAACSPDGQFLAVTPSYPREFSCEFVATRMNNAFATSSNSWATSPELPTGAVHLGIVSIHDDRQTLGTIVLVHDLSFISRRESTATRIMLLAYFILVTGASAITLIAARVAWKDWTLGLRRALKGHETQQQFLPILRDVRALAAELARENQTETNIGRWAPERLRSVLSKYLSGEKLVIVANREPYIHEKTATGYKVVHPASGLVTALEPILRACSGIWISHGSGSADRDVVDSNDHILVPPEEKSYLLRRIWLSAEEEQGYYYGYSNEGLWPLCHIAHNRPIFRTEDWEHYVRVNRRFAKAVQEEVDTDDPIILVQDYHLALAPKMIRELLPKATIISFWHIPWPNAERIGICPWREELISGLLGSSILGFHTQQHCNNFIDSVDAFMESRIDRETNAVIQGRRRTLVHPYPISVEWPVHWLPQVPDVKQARVAVRRDLGLSPDALLGVGIDRLDYTKGIEERLAAVDVLLEHYPEYRGRYTFAQLAAPSRVKIQRYQDLNDSVERTAEAINRKWGSGEYRPIVLLRSHHEPIEVFTYYRAAELCYVSSLHDGMNLVAKEFVSARDDDLGVLILSQFTGAARELTEALIVNPYDLKQAAGAMAAALRMSESEQQERMRSMRRFVSQFNVYRWAGRMLVDAAELRRKERLSGKYGFSAKFSQENES